MHENDPRIEIELSPTPADEQIITGGLRQHNQQHVRADGDLRFGVYLRGVEGILIGGLLARAGRGWLHVQSMWVESGLRGQGYGRQLLAAAEAEAQRRGCHSAHLDTFSFQARPFYERCGYEVFATLENYPDGYQRFFMRKALTGK